MKTTTSPTVTLRGAYWHMADMVKDSCDSPVYAASILRRWAQSLVPHVPSLPSTIMVSGPG